MTMNFLENVAITVLDGITNISDSLHEKLHARRAKKRARDKGGKLKPGLNKVLNSTRISEPVLDKGQWFMPADLRHENMKNFVEQIAQENRKQARLEAKGQELEDQE